MPNLRICLIIYTQTVARSVQLGDDDAAARALCHDREPEQAHRRTAGGVRKLPRGRGRRQLAIAGSCEEPGASGTGDAGPRGPRRREAPATASCSELTRMDAFARDVSDYAEIAEAVSLNL